MAFTATIEPIITNIALRALQATVPSLSAFSFGVEQGAKSKGDKAKVFLHGAVPNPSEFDAETNNYATASDINFSEIEVPLNKLQKITMPVVRQQLRNGLVLQNLIEDMVQKVISWTVKDAILLATAAEFVTPVHIGSATTLTSDIVAKFAGVAANAGWNPKSVHLVIETDYYTNLVTDDDLKIVGGPKTEAQIETGIVQTLSGVVAHRYPGLTGPANENLVGILTDGSGIAIGFAENELEMGVENKLEMNQVIRAPGGPIIAVRLLASGEKNKAFLTVEALTGSVLARKAGLRRLISATP